LFIHCSYTSDRFQLTPEIILKWHLQDNQWSRPGYSDLILRDGTLHNLHPYNQDDEVDHNEKTWGVKGVNGISRHLCIEGGKDDNGDASNPLNVHTSIVHSLRTYLEYTILRHPLIKIAGHYQFQPDKPFCPGFNVPQFCKGMNIPESNIFTG